MADVPLFEIRKIPPDEQLILLSDKYMEHVAKIATLESERSGYVQRAVELENVVDRTLTEYNQAIQAIQHLYQHLIGATLTQDCETVHPFIKEHVAQ